jgi:uncharacterized protein YndB with AHSA1/START domain
MNSLTIERNINAPLEKVWDAFTNPEVLRTWFTPPGMKNAFISADVKEEGLFRYCFKMNDGGAEFWGRGIYKKIEEPTYLSYMDTFTDAEGNPVPPSHFGMPGTEIVETLTEFFFTSNGETTTMKLVAENPFDEKMTGDMTAGWNGMFDSLVKVVG